MSRSTTLPMPGDNMAVALWPPVQGTASWLRPAVLAVVGSAILALSAKVQIPLPPVPFTMQTFVVLVLGMAYGWRLAGVTLLLYLFEGAALQLPVFAKGGGAVHLVGPTAGYLWGFLTAAMLTGWLASRGWDRTFTGTLSAMLLGTAVIFGMGVGWLASIVGVEKAFALGLVPFVYSEAAKIIMAALALPACWKWIGRRRG